MARPCSVCNHNSVEDINRLILEGKESYRGISRLFAVSEDAIKRHVDSGHIPIQATKAAEAIELTKADDLLTEIVSLKNRGMGLLDTAESTGDIKTAVQALKAVREVLTLMADVSGRLQAQQQVNIQFVGSPEFIQLKTRLMTANICPECRIAISEALR